MSGRQSDVSTRPCGEADVNHRLTSRTTTQPRRGLNRDEAAIYVGVTVASFDQMVSDGRLPKPADLDGEEVFDLALIDRAMDRLIGLRRSTL